MKFFNFIFALAAFSLCIFSGVNAQVTLVSKEWETDTGTQYFFRKSKVITDASLNTFIVGETVNGQGNYDWLVVKYDYSGNVVWADQFNGAANSQDMAIDVYLDGSANLYVAGGVTQVLADSMDVCLRKYNSSGVVQWTRYYNGSADGNDIGTSIAATSTGNILVGGTAKTSNRQDFLLACFKASNGAILWSQLYDYNGNEDAGVKVYVSTPLGGSGPSAYIAGGSQSDSVTWDFAVVRYNQSTGAFISVNRISGGVGTFHQLSDLTIDAQNNIYITGSFKDISGEEDIQLVKLDDSLTVIWDTIYPGPQVNGQDEGRSIQVDGSGNIYVTGFVTRSGEGKNLVLLKFNSSGVLQFSREYNGESNFDDSGQALALNGGEVVVTGYMSQPASGKDYLTLSFDGASGDLNWQAIYDGPSGYDDIATALAIDVQGNVLVSGQTQEGLVDFAYRTLKYTRLQRDMLIDTNGTDHVANEILVSFDPDILNLGFINDLEQTFINITELVPDSILDTLEAKTGLTFSGFPAITAIRVFTSMTTDDTLSIARTGDTVWIPKFWSTLLLQIPDGVDLQELCDSLNTLYVGVHSAGLNIVGEYLAGADDDYYNNMLVISDPNGVAEYHQYSLHDFDSPNDGDSDPDYPDAHIDIEPAWDKTSGDSYVRVGVFDSGIRWTHDDFSWDGSNTFQGSVIAGGKDYYYNPPMPVQNLSQGEQTCGGHGTAVSGIIGAVRNNAYGIAGIAGGDKSLDKKGVALFSMQTCGTYIALDALMNMAYEGASSSHFRLNVTNHSYSITASPSPVNLFNEDFYSTNSAYFLIKYLWRNAITNVAANGNYPQVPFGAQYYLTPASSPDPMVLAVGSSGEDGLRMHYFDNSGENGEAIYGTGMDILAPGSYRNILSTSIDGPNPILPFSQSSAAAPHASGVAALLMSLQNEQRPGNPANLAPEDVEFLIQKYATPVQQDWACCNGGTSACCVGTSPLSVPNMYSGYGKLNAGATIPMLNYPAFEILHSGTPDAAQFQLEVSQANNFKAYSGNLYDLDPVKRYCVDIYKYSANFHTDVGNNSSILDYWPRESATYGVPLLSNVSPQFNYINGYDWYADYTFTLDPNGHELDVDAYTYVYHVTGIFSGGVCSNTLNVYVPDLTKELNLAYSLHVFNPLLSSVDSSFQDSELKLFPNPANDLVFLQFNSNQTQQGSIQVINAMGQLVYSDSYTFTPSGINTVEIPLAGFASGLYFCRLIAPAQTYSQKFIVN